MKITTLLTLIAAAVLLPATALASGATPVKCEQYEVGFSPEGSAEALVIKTIDSAQRDITMIAYSFTSKEVVKALLRARKRNAAVSIVADASNLSNRAGIAALSAVTNAGAVVRTISAYKITHDKVIIVDNSHVEFGSFNFSAAAAIANSENVNVCWNSPGVASIYYSHFKSRWDQAAPFQTRY